MFWSVRSATTTAPSRTPGTRMQGALDLADFDPEAMDLDLGVRAAQELQLAIRLPAAIVAAAVEPLTRAVRIGHERQPGALGVVDVAAPHADPGEDDRTGGAQRHRRQVLVDDVDVYVVDRATERDPCRRSARRSMTSWLVSSEVSVSPYALTSLISGWAANQRCDELLLQRLAGDRHAAQVRQLLRALLQVGHDGFEIRRHDLEHSDPAIDDLVDEPLDVQNHVLLDYQGSAADQERRDQLPQRDVEALRRGLGDHLTLADLQIVDLGVHVIEHSRVLAHGALGLAGRAGREVDVGKLIRRDVDAEVVVGVILLAGRLDEDLSTPLRDLSCLAERGGAGGFGQRRARQSARESVVAIRSAGKCGSIGRYAPPALKTARTAAIQSRLRSVTTATTPSRAQPPRQKRPRQPVGATVQLAVGQLAIAVHRRDRVRVGAYPLLEQLVDPEVGQLAAWSGKPVELKAEFLGG